MNKLLLKLQPLIVTILSVAVFIRAYETIGLFSNPVFHVDLILYEFIGLCSDVLASLLIVLLFSVVCFVPQRLYRPILLIVLLFYVAFSFVSIGLSGYFVLLLYPLDKVVFSFSLSEIVAIASASSRSFWIEIIPFVIVIALSLTVFVFSKRIKNAVVPSILYVFLCLVSAVTLSLNLNEKWIDSRLYVFITENRVYQLTKYNDIQSQPVDFADSELDSNIDFYHSIHCEHNFVNRQYPLLHNEDYSNDVLRPFFDTISHKPNVVFIIVESLSRSVCGPGAKNGSCTPFIDSLIHHSLYWENQFSTAERTFEIFPSSLASLPYGKEGFTRLSNMPNHLSIVKLLGINGYYTSFLHPADFKIYFDNWWRFFAVQGIDTILDINSFPKLSGFSSLNGSPDEILFEHAGNFFNENNSRPQFSVLLTTSMHEPFIIPDMKRYENAVQGYINENTKLTTQQKEILKSNLSRSAAVFYTDNQLRKYFNIAMKSSQFNNTIFVIFGDHSVYNYDPHNHVQQYHVPLIIYSPLIKKPKTFSGVNSHLDITPTLLCFLKNACNLTLPKYTHWLGNRLDTSTVPTATKRIPFMSVSRVCKDYLLGNNYLSGDYIYNSHDCNLTKLDDDEKYKELQKELFNYLYINKFVCTKNRLIPDSIFYAFSNDVKKMKDLKISAVDNFDPTQEFYELHNSVLTDKSVKNYSAKLSLEMKCSKTGVYEVPRLIISAKDLKTNSDVCYQIEFFHREDWKKLESDMWQKITVAQSTNFLKTDFDSLELKVYLWNSTRVPVFYKNIHFELISEKKSTIH